MAIAKIKLSFLQYKDSALATKAAYIVMCLDGKSLFIDPIPTLGLLQGSVLNYQAALLAAGSSAAEHVATKDKMRGLLEKVLRKTGYYLMYVADGDEAMLASSGYDLVKAREPLLLVAAGLVTIRPGLASMQMIAKAFGSKGGKSKIYEICTSEPTSDTVWIQFPSTLNEFTFRNLIPGAKYWIRVDITGTGEQVLYTPIVSQHAT